MKNVVKKSLSVVFAIIMALSCFATAFAADSKKLIVEANVDGSNIYVKVYVETEEGEDDNKKIVKVDASTLTDNIKVEIFQGDSETALQVTPKGALSNSDGLRFEGLTAGARYTIKATADGYTEGTAEETIKYKRTSKPEITDYVVTTTSISVTKLNGADVSATANTDAVYKISRADGSEDAKLKENYPDWSKSPVFKDLTSGVLYTITVKFAESKTYLESEEYSKDIKTKIASTEPSKAVSFSKVTKNSITFNAIDNYEYSLDGGKTFQKSNVFSNLKSGSVYTATQRYVDPDGLQEPSAQAANVTIRTNTADAYNANFSDVKVEGISNGGKVSTDSSISIKAYPVMRSSSETAQWGDTRYVVESVKVDDGTAEFKEASTYYQITVKISKSGSKKVEIVYKQQKYTEKGWEDTNITQSKTYKVTASTKAQDIFSVITNQLPELIAKAIKWLMEKGLSIIIFF